jgi:putative lipoprotein
MFLLCEDTTVGFPLQVTTRSGVRNFAPIVSASLMSPGRSGFARAASIAVLLVLLLLAPAAQAQAQGDDWWGRDKALHFSVSAVIATGGYGGAALVTEDRRWRLLTGGGLAIAAGAGKELADAAGFGDASWKDFTWDLIGAATGVGVAWLVDHLFSAPQRTLRHSQ